MNRYLVIAALGAASLAATGVALASPAPPLLRAETGSALAYHVVFDGSFWNGEKTAFARDVRLTALGGGAIGVVSAGPAKGDAANAQGTLRKNGEIDVHGAADRVRSYNTIVQILRTAPASIEPGSTWAATVPMQFNDTDTVADFPITVKAVSDASGLVLQGTGTQTITTSYSGYSVPIDVDVRLALRLTQNGFDRCDFAASEVVHAGPQTQTLSWKWAMTAAAAAPKV